MTNTNIKVGSDNGLNIMAKFVELRINDEAKVITGFYRINRENALGEIIVRGTELQKFEIRNTPLVKWAEGELMSPPTYKQDGVTIQEPAILAKGTEIKIEASNAYDDWDNLFGSQMLPFISAAIKKSQGIN